MRRVLHASLIVVLVAVAWIVLLPPRAIEQPIAFNHAAHTDLACAVCHEGAETGVRAGIPQGQVCLNCHVTAPAAADVAQWDRIARGEPVAWIRVTQVPEDVFFSHGRHVGLGNLACVSCHGDIGTRTAPPSYAPIRLTMETCIACHTVEHGDDDCASCHR